MPSHEHNSMLPKGDKLYADTFLDGSRHACWPVYTVHRCLDVCVLHCCSLSFLPAAADCWANSSLHGSSGVVLGGVLQPSRRSFTVVALFHFLRHVDLGRHEAGKTRVSL